MSDRYAKQLEALHRSVTSGDESAFEIINQSSKPEFNAQTRVNVYHHGYRKRLMDAVSADYPTLNAYLDAGAFSQLVKDYVQGNPSQGWDLNYYPVPFAAYLKGRVADDTWALAELESAIAEVFWLPDSVALPSDKLAQLGEAGLPGYHFTLRSASRLLAFDYDVEAQLRAFRAGESISPAQESACYLLVYRHRNTVRRLRLEEAGYQLIQAFASGLCFSEAIASLSDEAQAIAGKRLSAWLSEWLQAGIFQDKA